MIIFKHNPKNMQKIVVNKAIQCKVVRKFKVIVPVKTEIKTIQ